MQAVELFAGAGGLALGTAEAGFRHRAVVEVDRNACETIETNKTRGIIDWPLYRCDIRDLDFGSFKGEVDLVAGGPPCQPFSIGGKHRGHEDDRNLFPEAVRAIREIRPKAVMLENVKGLLRETFSKFFEYVLLQISHPELTQKPGEDWLKHLRRLERHHTGSRYEGLQYHVVFRRLNAADYGVAQRRERVIVVAFRSDIDADWSFPEPTHSAAALHHDQWVTGRYWERHGLKRAPRNCKRLTRTPLHRDLFPKLPWRTVRDAIMDLPEPSGEPTIPNHRYQAGAKVYKGHTGSPLDLPAKTLKAGDHGVPGGENMLLNLDGSVRYFTVRECARLQAFPDDFVFEGSWTESMRQLGNAVPVSLAKVVAKSVATALNRGAEN